MVGVRLAGHRAGRGGKLAGDPAIEAAAHALDAGVSDPLGYLALSRDDEGIVNAVLTRALHIRAERDQAHLDYLASRTAGLTTSGFSRVMKQAVRALRPWR